MRLPLPVARRLVRISARLTTDTRLTFDVQRRRYDSFAAGLALPRGTRVEQTELGGVPVERVTASTADGDSAIVHLHGGGFCIGSPVSHRSFAARLSAAARAAVVVPDYRRAPEHPCPAAADDAYAVWCAVTGEHPTAALSGDSAGGALALLTAARARDLGGVLPSRLTLISPFVDAAADHAADPGLLSRDIVLTPDWLTRCALSYAAGRPLDNPEVSVIHQDLHGLPPTLVVVGTDEVLAPQCDRLVATLRETGGDVAVLHGQGLWHIYPTQAGLVAAADHAVAVMAEFTAAGMRQRALSVSA